MYVSGVHQRSDKWPWPYGSPQSCVWKGGGVSYLCAQHSAPLLAPVFSCWEGEVRTTLLICVGSALTPGQMGMWDLL